MTIITISENLNFDTVPYVQQRVHSELKQATQSATIDLSQVDHSDSAGLALLIDCARFAKQQGIELHFNGIPAQLRHLAEFTHVDQLLAI